MGWVWDEIAHMINITLINIKYQGKVENYWVYIYSLLEGFSRLGVINIKAEKL